MSRLRLRSRIGTTMSFVSIFDSASESTTIMAVAAEKPPRNTRIDSAWFPADSGSSSTNWSACVRGSISSPAMAIGRTNRLMRKR